MRRVKRAVFRKSCQPALHFHTTLDLCLGRGLATGIHSISWCLWTHRLCPAAWCACGCSGAIEATQTENKTTTRNDRLIAVATEAHDYQHLRTLKDIEKNLRRELEHFFTTYHQMNGVKFKILGLCAPARAKMLIEKASRKIRKKKKSA